MKIWFFWTPELAKNILYDLFSMENIEIPLVFSQPDKPVWRWNKMSSSKVKEFCLEKGLNIMTPEKIRKDETIVDTIKAFDLDFIVVVAYWKIIPKSILDIPKYWCINIHGSILPKYRWASPIQQSRLNWDTETWITIMYMNEKMDEWDMLSIHKVDVDKFDTSLDIFNKFSAISAKKLVDTLTKVISWDIVWVPQNHSDATYCTMINKSDWEINFKKESAENIFYKNRAYFPWPWTFVYFNWKKLTLEGFDYSNNEIDWKIWEVILLESQKVAIKANKWYIFLEKVKLEWKKSCEIKDFLNGQKDFIWYIF